MSQSPTTHLRSEDEIDLRALFLALWTKKHLILAASSTGLLLASLYAFLIARPTYESTALLLPTQSTAPDQLGAAAALLGKKSSSSVDVELYQNLLTSRTVIRKLLVSPILSHDDTAHGRTYPLYAVLKVDTGDALQMDAATQMLTTSITVGAKNESESGILEVILEARAPWLAQQMTDQLLRCGQEELRKVRIERSDIILARLNQAVEQARGEWETTARQLTLYRDRNRSITLPEQELELARLEIDKTAKEQKFLLARKEYEGLVLEREKAAPPLMILDPADLPVRKSKPKRIQLILLGMITGGGCSITALLGWHILFAKSSVLEA